MVEMQKSRRRSIEIIPKTTLHYSSATRKLSCSRGYERPRLPSSSGSCRSFAVQRDFIQRYALGHLDDPKVRREERRPPLHLARRIRPRGRLEPLVRHPAVPAHLVVPELPVRPRLEGELGRAPRVLDQEEPPGGVVADGEDGVAAGVVDGARRRRPEHAGVLEVGVVVEVGGEVKVEAEDEGEAVVDAPLELGDGRRLHRAAGQVVGFGRLRVDDSVPDLGLDDSVIVYDPWDVSESVVPGVVGGRK